MKNIIQIDNLLTRSSLAIALAGIALQANSALAQEKGASVLMRLNQSQASAVSQPAAPKTVLMSCPNCQDQVKQVSDWSAKGGQILMAGGRPTKSVAQHQVEGCSTKVNVLHGKAK